MDSIDSTPSDQVVVQVVGSITNVDAEQWNALTEGMPLLSYAFLSALEKSRSVGPGTGWNPCIITVNDGQTLMGAMPLYIKGHSYGEYVLIGLGLMPMSKMDWLTIQN